MRALKGIYLVIDPAMARQQLLAGLGHALNAGIDVLQIWNHWPKRISGRGRHKLIAEILRLAEPHRVPVLINEDWRLLGETGLQGVHFDDVPDDWEAVKKHIAADAIVGLTVGNDPALVRWADADRVDYLSFCAMFPSASVDECEIVDPGAVLQARRITNLPLFLSGGIRPDNIPKLAPLDFQGIAVISGVMSTDAPAARIRRYRSELEKLQRSDYEEGVV